MSKIILLGLLICPTLNFAEESESSDVTHFAAHVGASYAITHATEVVCTKSLGKEHRFACTLAGIATSLGAGMFKEHVLDGSQNHTSAYVSNITGIGLAVTMIGVDW